ncbi:PHD-finger domain-containing protein [Seiridium cupressi]
MPSTRKRTLRDVESDATASNLDTPKETSLLQRIRNAWQFANLFQWIFLFGKVVKIDENIDIDILETECLKHHSTVLIDIGLALLKFVSSHRGLTPELFDEYTRRQYVAKKPSHNPFGTDEAPAKFHDFDIFTKLKVLQQLTQWVMLHPERIRDKMDEQKLSDQTDWRIEPYGWDSEDREYYLLDDDRLYRRTEAPPPTTTWKPKKSSKKAKAATRAAKRRRVSRSAAADAEDTEDGPASEAEETPVLEDDGFGGAKWECIAVSLGEVRAFLNTLRKTRDENEKILRDRIEDGLVPILEKQEESRKRKMLAREKELLTLEKLAHAKRSSRLAGKADRQKQEEEDRLEEEKRRREEAAARKEEQLRLKKEKERDNRMMSRENRLKEREVRRLKHQEELAQLSEDSRNVDSDSGSRLSGRRLEAEIARNKQALRELEDEEEEWIFDCVCGVYGQVDDGTHSIACEKCGVWQHSKCAGISEKAAERDDFHFVCNTCKRREAHPKPTVIKLRVKSPNDALPSPRTAKSTGANAQQRDTTSQQPAAAIESLSQPTEKPDLSPFTNGATSHGQYATASRLQHSSPQAPAQPIIPIKPTSQTPILPPPSPFYNHEASNPFSSPHPTLSPPQQSPNKSRAYSTINQSSPSASVSPGAHKILPPKGVFHISPKVNGAVASQKDLAGNMPPNTSVAFPSGAATAGSPVKQPLQDTARLPGVSSPQSSFSTARRPSSSSAVASLLSTPQLKHGQPEPASDVKTPTLPPTQNGISPLKRSPPHAQQSANGVRSSPAPPLLPPFALSPTPSKQILTPPVKPAEPLRPTSQQSNSTAEEL